MLGGAKRSPLLFGLDIEDELAQRAGHNRQDYLTPV